MKRRVDGDRKLVTRLGWREKRHGVILSGAKGVPRPKRSRRIPWNGQRPSLLKATGFFDSVPPTFALRNSAQNDRPDLQRSPLTIHEILT